MLTPSADGIFRVSIQYALDEWMEQILPAASLSPRPGAPRTRISLQRPCPSLSVGFPSDRPPLVEQRIRTSEFPTWKGSEGPRLAPVYGGEPEPGCGWAWFPGPCIPPAQLAFLTPLWKPAAWVDQLLGNVPTLEVGGPDLVSSAAPLQRMDE